MSGLFCSETMAGYRALVVTSDTSACSLRRLGLIQTNQQHADVVDERLCPALQGTFSQRVSLQARDADEIMLSL